MEFLSLLSTIHWDVLAKIIAIDVVLGIDNAIIIALACAALAPELRNKAVIIGTAGAILARILFLFIGFYLVGLPFVKILAGAYLIYLAYSMVQGNTDEHNIPKKTTVLAAGFTIIVSDILMSLDNTLALIGASEGTGDHAFAYTVFGILLSIPIIIFASKGLIKAIDKFPIIIWVGSGLIAWVGTEMMLKEPLVTEHIKVGSVENYAVACVIVLTTLTIAFFKNKKSVVDLNVTT